MAAVVTVANPCQGLQVWCCLQVNLERRPVEKSIVDTTKDQTAAIKVMAAIWRWYSCRVLHAHGNRRGRSQKSGL